MKSNTAFMLDLAQVLERHNIAVVATLIEGSDKYCEVRFMSRGKNLFTTNI